MSKDNSASIFYIVWNFAYLLENVGLGDGAYVATIELAGLAEAEIYE